jgi:hypothetical protein
MASVPEQLVHLVLRTAYEELPSGLLAASHAADEGEPVRAFADRGRADDWREDLEEAERRKTEPFWFARYVPAANAELAAQARDRGLMPPSLSDPHGYDPAAWSWWWQRVVLTQPGEQAGGLWEDFGGGRFYELADVPLDGNSPGGGEPLFVVRRLAWDYWRFDGPRVEVASWHLSRDRTGRIVFGRSVRAFANRHEADAFRTQTERRDRAGKNPFDFDTGDDDPLASRTSLDYPRLHDWLLDCGAARAPDPDATAAGWQAWWERTVPGLSPLQQAKAWEAFDRLRLYDVIDVPWDDGA